jgi:hypothetical protein
LLQILYVQGKGVRKEGTITKRLIVYSLLFIVSGSLFCCPLFADDQDGEVNFCDFNRLIAANWLSDENNVNFSGFAAFAGSWECCEYCPCCVTYMPFNVYVRMTCELEDPPVVYTGNPALQSDGFYYGYLHTTSGDYAVVGVQFCWDHLGNGQSRSDGWGYINVVNLTCQCTGADFPNPYPHCLMQGPCPFVVEELPAPYTLYCRYEISWYDFVKQNVSE